MVFISPKPFCSNMINYLGSSVCNCALCCTVNNFSTRTQSTPRGLFPSNPLQNPAEFYSERLQFKHLFLTKMLVLFLRPNRHVESISYTVKHLQCFSMNAMKHALFLLSLAHYYCYSHPLQWTELYHASPAHVACMCILVCMPMNKMNSGTLIETWSKPQVFQNSTRSL